MIISAKSSVMSLFFNGNIQHILNPWVIVVDFESQHITILKRNWYLIGVNRDIIAFRLLRNIVVNEHLFGADIAIKAIGGTVSARFISKRKAKHIREAIMDYNAGKKSSYVIG